MPATTVATAFLALLSQQERDAAEAAAQAHATAHAAQQAEDPENAPTDEEAALAAYDAALGKDDENAEGTRGHVARAWLLATVEPMDEEALAVLFDDLSDGCAGVVLAEALIQEAMDATGFA